MKRLITFISALLITAGLKAQSNNVQKETVKPVANTNTATKGSNNTAIKKTETISKADVKSNEFKNAAIKKADFKNAAIKKAAVATDKAAQVKQ